MIHSGIRQSRSSIFSALIHCHVGPDYVQEPKVRVPFPAMEPRDALDWVLATALEELEPEPWPKPAP